MHRSTFWTTWLLVVAFTMSAFGVLMFLFNQTVLMDGLMGEIERAFPSGAGAGGFQQWVFGVWGATVAGFGLLAGLVGGNAFARRERWARNALAAALTLWYVLDTAVSLYSRVWINAVFNTVVLVAMLLPLLFTWKEFRGRLPPGRETPAPPPSPGESHGSRGAAG